MKLSVFLFAVVVTLVYSDGIANQPEIAVTTPATHCLADDFRCNDGSCIRAAYRCDYIDDCLDKSDEQNCSNKSEKGMNSRNTNYRPFGVNMEKKYRLETSQQVSWFSTVMGCFIRRQTLATIRNEEENNKLVEILNNSNVTDVWVGGLNFGDKGLKWATTAMPITYSDWVPDDEKLPTEGKGNATCVHLHKFENHGFRWNNISCSNKYYFVCEYY